MTAILLAGSANRPLATAIAEEFGIPLGACELAAFPDGELHVSVRDSVRNADVYLVQPTSPPVERHLLELLLLADACRRAGAQRITTVVPYFGYAHQDRRAGAAAGVGQQQQLQQVPLDRR
jgi:ribose-phosphate pyrophosphokinase